MKRKVFYRPIALQDLDDISAYLRRMWGEAKARSYGRRLAKDIRTLQNAPLRQPLFAGVQEGIRRRSSQRHAIFYIVHDDKIEIVRILHKQSDFTTKLD